MYIFIYCIELGQIFVFFQSYAAPGKGMVVIKIVAQNMLCTLWSKIGLFRNKIGLTTLSMETNAFNKAKYLIYFNMRTVF